MMGKEVSAIGRAADMLCMSFGKVVRKNIRGDSLSEFEIHVQCSWSLVNSENTIVVAKRDIFLPPTDVPWSPSFNWDVKGGNLFDEIISSQIMHFSDYHIEALRISKTNHMTIRLGKGIHLEVFPDSSCEENWRIVQREIQSVHLVCKGTQLAFE